MCLPIKCTGMADLTEALTVLCNFPLLVFPLYITFKSGITAAGERIRLE